jgi:hypothetical protein
LTARLEKTVLSEKMVEEDLSWVEESATKSRYRLGVGFERCEKKGEKSAPKFVPSSSYHKEEEALKPTKAHYPSNPKPSFNPKREARKETPKLRGKLLFAYFVAVLVTWMSFASGGRELRGDVLSMLDSYRHEFIDFSLCSYSHVLRRFYSRASPHTFSRAFPRTSSGALPQFAH